MHTIVIPLVGLWFLGLLSKTLVAPSSVTSATTLDWDRGFTHPHRDLVSSLRRGENSHVRTQTCCWWLFSVWRPTLSFGKSEISKLPARGLVLVIDSTEGFQFTGLTANQSRIFSTAFPTPSSQTSATDAGIMDELRHDQSSFRLQSLVCRRQCFMLTPENLKSIVPRLHSCTREKQSHDYHPQRGYCE